MWWDGDAVTEEGRQVTDACPQGEAWFFGVRVEVRGAGLGWLGWLAGLRLRVEGEGR